MGASFCSGTRILTTRGRVRVEKLRLGDQVITVEHGPQPVRWIGYRIYSRPFLRLNPSGVPIRVQVGAIDDGVPSRDLFLSPFHSLFIDGALIPVEALVNGVSITRCEEMDPVAYYNIEVPMHAVVLAEDAPAETYVDRGDRAMFMSAVFSDPPQPSAASFRTCAPILQSGPVVERVRARLALRAGIVEPNLMERPQGGPLRGRLEWASHGFVSGWAWLPDHPHEPVVLEILDQREIIAVVLADQFRGDLRSAGIGEGNHAFHLELPRRLDPAQAHRLVARRAADCLPLPGVPFVLPPHRPAEALADLDLAAMIHGADLSEAQRVIAWLEQQAVKLHALLTEGPPFSCRESQEVAATPRSGTRPPAPVRPRTRAPLKDSRLA